jgi:glycosyltransferase involved in cell wall biosynthesis
MQIAIDVTPLTPHRSGVGYFLHYQLQALQRAGTDFTWRFLASGLHRPALDGLDGFAGGRYLPMPTRMLYTLWDTLRYPRADSLAGGADIFHATNYYLPPVRCAKRVLTIYDLAFLRSPGWCSPKVVGPFSQNVPRFAREADAIVTCSEASKQDIVELIGVAPEKVTVCHGAADTALVPMPRDAAKKKVMADHGLREPYILFVSTREPRKNVVGLLRAFKRVARLAPHQLILVGGPGWGLPPIEKMTAEMGIADRVKVLGYVPTHEALAALYGAADLFVLPSWYEGFGLPVLEAMTCGCPVVTSPVASLPEVAGDAAQYADPGEPEAIAAAMLAVLGDRALRARMAEAGHAQARKFTWEASANALLGVYRGLA